MIALERNLRKFFKEYLNIEYKYESIDCKKLIKSID